MTFAERYNGWFKAIVDEITSIDSVPSVLKLLPAGRFTTAQVMDVFKFIVEHSESDEVVRIQLGPPITTMEEKMRTVYKNAMNGVIIEFEDAGFITTLNDLAEFVCGATRLASVNEYASEGLLPGEQLREALGKLGIVDNIEALSMDSLAALSLVGNEEDLRWMIDLYNLIFADERIHEEAMMAGFTGYYDNGVLKNPTVRGVLESRGLGHLAELITCKIFDEHIGQ